MAGCQSVPDRPPDPAAAPPPASPTPWAVAAATSVSPPPSPVVALTVPEVSPRITPSTPEAAAPPAADIPLASEEEKAPAPVLPGASGTIRVSSRPAGARVFVNGTDTEKTTTLTGFTVAAGPVTVDVSLKGYQRARATRVIEPAGSGEFDFALKERQSYLNSLGMELVPVEGMPDALFSAYETRVEDFRAFARDRADNGGYNYQDGEKPYILNSGGWKKGGWDYGWENPGFAQGDSHPVTCVSWDDAKRFCAWLTRKEEMDARGLEYRLPTDHEWSVAVGLTDEDPGRSPAAKDGETPGVYPWGREYSSRSIRGNYAGEEARDDDWPRDWFVREGYRDRFPRTAPVEESVENAGGLSGLGGNVWEWCEDRYHEPDEAEDAERVLRGGSWSNFDQMLLLSSCRGSAPPGYRYGLCGFRCVLASRTPGAGLFGTCPRCGGETTAWEKNCVSCGADIVAHRELRNRLAAGRRYLEDRAYIRSAAEFMAALALEKGNEEAREGMQEANRLIERAEELKAEALLARKDERYEAEAAALERLLGILPGEPSVAARLGDIPAAVKYRDAESLRRRARAARAGKQFEAEEKAWKDLLLLCPEDGEGTARLGEMPGEIRRRESEALAAKSAASLSRREYQTALRYGREALGLEEDNAEARRLIGEASKAIERRRSKAAAAVAALLAVAALIAAILVLAHNKNAYDSALAVAIERERAKDWSKAAAAATGALGIAWPFKSGARDLLGRTETHLSYAAVAGECEAKISEQGRLLEEYGGEAWKGLRVHANIGRESASDPVRGAEEYRLALSQLPAAVAEAETARAQRDYESALRLALEAENRGKWADTVAAADRALGTGWTDTSAAAEVLERMRDKVPLRFGSPGRNSLGMEFVPVEGLNNVLFSTWPTRVRDYDQFVTATGHRVPECVDWGKASWNTWRRKQPPTGYGDHPVVGVSREDARMFCDWLTRKESLDRMGLSYRLPTDHEWSLAAGLTGEDPALSPDEKDAGIADAYPWGQGKGAWPPPRGAGNYSPGLKVDDDEYTSPVGKYGKQANGLCDMGGNVWEWCEDAYHAADDADNADRVLRGGSWLSRGRASLLSSARDGAQPGGREADFGFRCVLAPART